VQQTTRKSDLIHTGSVQLTADVCFLGCSVILTRNISFNTLYSLVCEST